MSLSEQKKACIDIHIESNGYSICQFQFSKKTRKTSNFLSMERLK